MAASAGLRAALKNVEEIKREGGVEIMTNPLKGMDEEQIGAWMDQPPTRHEIYSIIAKMVRADVLVTSALSQMMSDDMDAAIPILKSALQVLESASDLLPLADPHILIAMGVDPAEVE